MQVRILFLLLCATIHFSSIASNYGDSLRYKMGVYDFNIGLDGHYSGYHKNNQSNYNIAGGPSARMQSSVLGYLDHGQRFLVADLLSAEFAAGTASSYYSRANSSIWLSYRFEFGLATLFRINKKNDIGLNLILLRFAHDNVSENQSGSGIVFRYRYSRLQIETGMEARRDRVAGWIVAPLNNYPMQFSFAGKYLIDEHKNVGFRCDLLPNQLNVDNESFDHILSFRLFYGIYF